ncbi:MAG: hypothetical protein JWN85_1192 [Gammaproteobacteria bacterium]|nr:hypothetical protein [Gammaproteobacteria bacterium]
MHTGIHKRRIAAKVSLLLISTSMSIVAVTNAQEAKSFLLTAYANAAGGENLVSGRYNAALAQITSNEQALATPERDRKTNACVAYAALGQLRQARVACDAAVTAAQRHTSHSFRGLSKDRVGASDDVAIAYTNRAIVHSLSHKAVSSAEDLAKAHSLAPTADFVARNIATFRDSHGGAAQVAVTAR